MNQFNRFLHETIPATKAMGFKVIEWNSKHLLATAPLKPNINDKGTFFGGSGSSIMIISGWSFIKLLCKNEDIDADIVIFKNQTKWLKPLNNEAKIEAKLSQNWDSNSVQKRLESGKSIPMEVEILMKSSSGELKTSMMAKYFIVPKKID